jgi:putative ABC transport system permease protein
VRLFMRSDQHPPVLGVLYIVKDFVLLSIAQDLRYALRSWRGNPLPILASLFALSLGIGASAAVFSVVNGVLLRPLPFPRPEQLVRVFESDARAPRDSVSMQDLADWKASLQSFTAIAVYRPDVANLLGNADPLLVRTIQSDPDLFRVLRINVVAGRNFTARDNQPGSNPVALLSRAFWRTHFGSQAVIGRKLRLDGAPRTIVGVLPDSAEVIGHADMWTPAPFDFSNRANTRGYHSYNAMARLRAGVSLQQANLELSRAAANLASAYPEQNQGVGASAVSLPELLPDGLKTSLLLLLAAAICVLLLACGNVANLLLAKAAVRSRELSLRVALGAGRGRLFQQLITESLLLSLTAAAGGLALAKAAIVLVVHLDNIGIPRPKEVTLDAHVLLFALSAAIFAGTFFSLLPALAAFRSDVGGALRQAGNRMTDSKRRQSLRRLFVAIEAAVAALLLIESVLLIRSFEKVSSIDPGFQPNGVMTLYLSLPAIPYGQDSDFGARLAERLLPRVRALPGIENAAFTTDLPFDQSLGGTPIAIQGRPVPKNVWKSPFVFLTAVTSGYCRTLKIPLLAGRDFAPTDDAPLSPAVLVNQALVRRFFPNANPLGQAVSYRFDRADWHTIVGVIGDTPQQGPLETVIPQMYLPLYRQVNLWPALVFRTSGNPLKYTKAIQEQLRQVDPNVPLFKARSMSEVVDEQMEWRAFHTSLLAVFAAMALVLSCVGVYAVIAYSVTQRTSEIGIRMVCGASRESILQLIFKQGLLPAAIGTFAGALAAPAAAKLFSQLLYGVTSTDYPAYLSAVVLLLSVAATASYFPARRAANMEPWRALRHE